VTQCKTPTKELATPPSRPVEHLVFRPGAPSLVIGSVMAPSWYAARQEARQRWGERVDCLTPDLHAQLLEEWQKEQEAARQLVKAQYEAKKAKAEQQGNGKRRKA